MSIILLLPRIPPPSTLMRDNSARRKREVGWSAVRIYFIGRGHILATSIIIVGTTLALWSSLSNATLFSSHLRRCHSRGNIAAARSKSSLRTPSSLGFAFPNLFLPTMKKAVYGDIELEDRLLAMIENGGGSNSGNRRLDISNDVSSIVSLLEASARSVPRPAIAAQLYGRWKLLRTSNTSTASPIQRRAVDTSKFDIYQDIIIVDENDNDDVTRRFEKEDGATSGLLIRQIVEFSSTNRLYVDALGSTSAYPLDELTDRIGDGTILGINILGVSMVGKDAIESGNRPDSRIKFVFDEGKFDLFNGSLVIPYPVPFRNPVFRDAVKGWIDITYLSDRIRISRGNKGTTFILRKVT